VGGRVRLRASLLALILTGAIPGQSPAKDKPMSRPIIDTHIHIYQVSRPG
jgi:hypothetical protein